MYCEYCNQPLKETKDPRESKSNALYCPKCGIYYLDDEEVPHLFFDVPQLLNEVNVPGAPKFRNFRLSIDTAEKRHEHVPHFHIYSGKMRSVGYKIEDLSPLGPERNPEMCGHEIRKFLGDIRKWMQKPSARDSRVSNQQHMLNCYNRFVWT